MNTNTITVTNSNDVPFTVRIVRQGDRYGLKFGLVHDKAEPLIEFYDQRFQHTEYGQFVTRYYASTVAATEYPEITLYLKISDWFIDGPGLRRAVEFAASV